MERLFIKKITLAGKSTYLLLFLRQLSIIRLRFLLFIVFYQVKPFYNLNVDEFDHQMIGAFFEN